MFLFKKVIFAFVIIAVLFFSLNSAVAAKSRRGPLRSFGDYTQIINPLITGGLASQEKGFGHFAIIYGQSFLAMHSIKYIADKNKWRPGKRPAIDGKKDRYDGMPSGHTNSAWIAASYVRNFSEENKYLSIPLYITAAITGYSRVHAKEHTASQVIAGAALAEIVTYINSKLDWSNDYKSSNFYIGGDEVSASFEFRF